MRSFWGFSGFPSWFLVVDSERELLLMPGRATFSQSTTPPRAPYVSRIAIRLLRDTRRVLEYLEKGRTRSRSACGYDYDRDEVVKPVMVLTVSRVRKCYDAEFR
jgi:hypothetical protein